MNTTTQVSPGITKSLAALVDHDLQPSNATVYNIPEKPGARVPKLPLLRYEEECPTINVIDVDEKYCLSGYGDISVSEHYDVVETGEGDQKLRVPRLKHIRPRARHQTTKAVSDSVSKSDSDNTNEPLLTSHVRQLEPEFLRNMSQRMTTNPPDTPDMNAKEFFENLLRKIPPVRRRQRTLILPTSPASEAVDARPRPN
jgi:hypothetical protein